jgi:hypothetical protein
MTGLNGLYFTGKLYKYVWVVLGYFPVLLPEAGVEATSVISTFTGFL